MKLSEWLYLPIAAIFNCFFIFIWQQKLGRKKIQGLISFLLIFTGSLLNAWAIDVIGRLADISSLNHVVEVSLGCWLMLAAATSAKYYAVNGWSQKNFWIDYGGDLIGFQLMGLIIYALT